MHLLPVLTVCLQTDRWARGNQLESKPTMYMCNNSEITVNIVKTEKYSEPDMDNCDLKMRILDGNVRCRKPDMTHKQYCVKGHSGEDSEATFSLFIDDPLGCGNWTSEVTTKHDLNTGEIGKLAVHSALVYLGLRIEDLVNPLKANNKTLYTHCCGDGIEKSNTTHMLKTNKLVKHRMECLKSVKTGTDLVPFAFFAGILTGVTIVFVQLAVYTVGHTVSR